MSKITENAGMEWYGSVDMKEHPFFLQDRLSHEQIDKFLIFEGEELIFACREHWLPLVARLAKQIFLALVLATTISSVIFLVLGSPTLSIAALVLTVLVIGIMALQDLIHWSFHLYIATNKQIIEVHYSPLFSQAVNSVLLDQIRCTEIDVDMFGIIPELIGIGNVALTFDRPTHKEEFVIRGIRSPRKIASLLSAQIHQGTTGTVARAVRGELAKPLWIKELKKNKYRFIGETNYGYST